MSWVNMVATFYPVKSTNRKICKKPKIYATEAYDKTSFK